MVTLSPPAASRRAMASPMPRFPPVTRTERLICSYYLPAADGPGDDCRTRVSVPGRRRGGQAGRGGGAGSGVFEPEAALEVDLEVGDFAVHDLAADLGHL